MELLCYLALCGYGFLNIHFLSILVLQPRALRFYCVIHFDQGPRTINFQLL